MDTTTTAKRKRPAASDIADDAPTTVDEVSDAEVEEFYAILRRMRDATRRLGARPPPPRAPAWRPSFSWEDFADAPPKQAPPQQPADHERVAENATPPQRPAPGLDLNVEPPSDSPAAAAAPATPRSARAPA
uniref:Uncharacterized protein n=1 Tax=Oryza meridionalis TaxID=40149 RepID=A0A0E0BWH9_9ORYZ